VGKLLDQYIEVTNVVASKAPAGLRIGMHLCRGNNAGHWQAEGGYDAVAEKLFRQTRIDFFFLEYDSPRAGGFEPLRLVPDDKAVVLGLVSTKVGELEPEETIIGRLRDAARYIDMDRVAISPQCGFSSGQGGNKLSVEQEIAKMRRVVDVSRKIWN
jgi:5-methyltetrahydropteroyltriglutamate--homocysteine methyltransferase